MRICPGCRSVYSSDARVCPKDGLALIEYSVTFPLPAASPQPAPVPQQTSVLGSDETKVEPGMMVGDYRVEKAIAQGGMGTIYAAIHPLISKRVALKVLSRRFAQDSEQIARFVLEARAVNQIGHHNIVDIFAIGELTDGRKYLVMEYLDGLELNRVLANVGRLRPGEVLPIYEQLCDALAAAHEKGFVHRDLKPENVTILRRHPYPFIKILDFGIAKLRGTEQTAVGTVLGTPEYMAPEQCRAGKIDARVDVYALGVMLYELVTGKKPFYHPDPLRLLTLQTTEEPKPPSTITSISPQLEQIILRTLKKDPSERQQSVRELIHELRKAIPHTLPWTASLDAPVSKASVGDRTRTLPPQDLKAAHSGSSAPPTTPDSLAAASRDAQPSSFSSAPQHDTDRTDLVTTNTNFAAPTVPAPAEDSEAGGSGAFEQQDPTQIADTTSLTPLAMTTGQILESNTKAPESGERLGGATIPEGQILLQATERALEDMREATVVELRASFPQDAFDTPLTPPPPKTDGTPPGTNSAKRTPRRPTPTAIDYKPPGAGAGDGPGRSPPFDVVVTGTIADEPTALKVHPENRVNRQRFAQADTHIVDPLSVLKTTRAPATTSAETTEIDEIAEPVGTAHVQYADDRRRAASPHQTSGPTRAAETSTRSESDYDSRQTQEVPRLGNAQQTDKHPAIVVDSRASGENQPNTDPRHLYQQDEQTFHIPRSPRHDGLGVTAIVFMAVIVLALVVGTLLLLSSY